MRLTRIVLKELFGIFDYDISLNQEDRITILHGVNGCGKSTLLNLVNAAIAKDEITMAAASFKVLELHFDNKRILYVVPVNQKLDQQESAFMYVYSNGEKLFDWFALQCPQEDVAELIENVDWIADRLGSKVLPKAKNEPTELSPDKMHNYYVMEDYNSIESLLASLSVMTINAHRLLNREILRPAVGVGGQGIGKFSKNRNPHVMELCQENLTELIMEIEEVVRVRVVEMQKCFEERLPVSVIMTVPEMEEHIRVIDKRMKRLDALQMTHCVTLPLLLSSGSSEEDQKRLALKINDARELLQLWDGLLERYELFHAIINYQFRGKKMTRLNNEFVGFESETGSMIHGNLLSTGEQNWFIIFYKLLFETEVNTLVLLDEPELSLHIAWQQEMLSNITAIQRLRPLDVVIATHSPNIVFDRWDLMVELDGER